MIHVTPRYIRIKLDQPLYDRARQAAQVDRRSLANWLVVLVERALSEPRDLDSQRASDQEGAGA